ncbi:MAG: ribonuclease III [Syntrophobacterales bacterium]|nr:ribonuclease III [Syntrophobacterales bacterium]
MPCPRQGRRAPQLAVLQAHLGVTFRNPGLLEQALRHSSYVHENPECGPSNEQLEFLGDAVLSLAVSHRLLQAFPCSPEGELSRRRAALVNARTLAAVARSLDLGEHLLLGKGEERQGGRRKPSLLADALEAVLAAVYLDQGLEAAARLVETWLSPLLAAQEELDFQDAKTLLQEWAQARRQAPPEYVVLEESGPSHARVFRVALRLGGQTVAEGRGRSKKAAEQEAARRALAALEQGEEPPAPE